jgi:putative membrane protein
MVRAILIRWAVLAVAIAVTTKLLSGIDVSGGFWGYVWVAALFGIINALLGPILHLLALPLTVLTLGLFALVVNAALLGITAGLSDALSVDGFWTAVVAALIITVVSAVLNHLVRGRERAA